ncbi:MAG TPA: hypothetical protein VEF05_18795 [Terriglobales bacterium]|nr:hypothetical protein [Terriglobales bacterium]
MTAVPQIGRSRTEENPNTLKTFRRGKFFLSGLFAIVTSVFLVAPSAAQQTPAPAQQAPPADSSPSPNSAPADRSKSNADLRKQEETGTSNDRLFYALPNFLTVETKNVPPLTPGQKFKVVSRGAFDYIEFAWYAALAGISQAENSEPGFGQGAEGYGKRYGAYFADGTIENYMVGAVLPSLLRQDPRYYQLGQGGFLHRTEYAVSRVFVTRSDSGHAQFNFSEIVGSAMASGISTYSYHPRGDRNLPNAASVWGSQVGYDTITFVVKEFWPDIRRKLGKKK